MPLGRREYVGNTVLAVADRLPTSRAPLSVGGRSGAQWAPLERQSGFDSGAGDPGQPPLHRPPRENAPGRIYLLAGMLRCGICERRMESGWTHGRPAYRCRHGHSSATGSDTGRPPNAYVREDQILPYLPALVIRLAVPRMRRFRRRPTQPRLRRPTLSLICEPSRST